MSVLFPEADCHESPPKYKLQRLQYFELTRPEFTPNFVVMTIQKCDTSGTSMAKLAEATSCTQPKHLGRPSTINPTCGCCLEEFCDYNDVTLLPCYHVFC